MFVYLVFLVSELQVRNSKSPQDGEGKCSFIPTEKEENAFVVNDQLDSEWGTLTRSLCWYG